MLRLEVNSELSATHIAIVLGVNRRLGDTLKMARELHPGKKNNLDALCERYGVNNAHRTLHGALLDAELLAEVYAELAGVAHNADAFHLTAPEPTARRTAPASAADTVAPEEHEKYCHPGVGHVTPLQLAAVVHPESSSLNCSAKSVGGWAIPLPSPVTRSIIPSLFMSASVT